MEIEERYTKQSKWPKPVFWVATACLAAVGIGLGVIIGHFTAPSGPECVPLPTSVTKTDTPTDTPTEAVNVIDRINAGNIEENLR